MAQRESECFLVRRVADRGINKNIGDSHVRGDRLHRDRRSADRGNEIGNRDPRDIDEIKRLRQRVQDLEIRQEIKRLRQRVRDLELQRERRVKETDFGTIVWDDVNEEEEHPFDHPYPPIYQECSWEDKPRFDEDVVDFNEEFLLVRRALSGITVQEPEAINEDEDAKSLKGVMAEYTTTSPGNFYGVLNKDITAHTSTTEVEVVSGCETMVKGDPLNDPRILHVRLEKFRIFAQSSEVTKNFVDGYESLNINFKSQDLDNIKVEKYVEKKDSIRYDEHVFWKASIIQNNKNILIDIDEMQSTENLRMDKLHGKGPRGPIEDLGNNVNLLEDLNNGPLIGMVEYTSTKRPQQINMKATKGHDSNEVLINLDYANGSRLNTITDGLHPKPNENIASSSGYDLEVLIIPLFTTTGEQIQFRPIPTNVNRVGVPFDPGGRWL